MNEQKLYCSDVESKNDGALMACLKLNQKKPNFGPQCVRELDHYNPAQDIMKMAKVGGYA